MSRIIVVAGPTAVGKTKYAIEIARRFNGEIVSCDSMQLYKYMNIGSAKPSLQEQNLVKHYLIDTIDPRKEFSVAEYQTLAKNAINEILQKGKTPIISGGTGLYLNSILYEMTFSEVYKDNELRKTLYSDFEREGKDALYERLKALDSKAAERIHPNNVIKVIRALEAAIKGNGIDDFQSCQLKTKDYEPILIGLNRERSQLYERINMRVDMMVEEGLFKEVQEILYLGLKASDISMKGIGYKEVISYLEGEITYEDAIDLIKKNSRHLAKRQLTWFKRYEDMKWFNISEYQSDEDAIEDILKWIAKL